MCQQSLSVESVLQKMQSTLACTICLDLLTTPMTTKCGHTFCKLCIDRLLQGSKSSVPCPLCITTAITRRSAKQNKKIASLVLAVRNVIASIKKDCGVQEPIKKNLPLTTASVVGTEVEFVETPCIQRVTRKRGQPTSSRKEMFSSKKIIKATNNETGASTKILSEDYSETPPKAENNNNDSISLVGDSLIPSSCSPSQKLKVEQWLTKNESIQLPSDLSKAETPPESIKEVECDLELTQVFDFESKRKYNEANIQAHNTRNEEIENDHDFRNEYLSQASTVLFKHTEDTKIIADEKAEMEDDIKDEVSSEKENEKSMIIDNAGPKRGGVKRILTEPNSVGNSLKMPKKSQILFDRQEKKHIIPLKQTPGKTVVELACFGSGKKTLQKGTFPLRTLAGKPLNSEIIDLKQTNSKGHNTRLASVIKPKLLEFPKPSKLMTRSKTKFSPSWSRIEGARKDLRTKHTSLNITGGELKSTVQNKAEILGKNAESSQESSVIIVEDPSQVKAKIKTKSIRKVYSKVSSLKISKKNDVTNDKVDEIKPLNISTDTKLSEFTVNLKTVRDLSLKKGHIGAEKNCSNIKNSYVLQEEDKSSLCTDSSQPKTVCVNINTSDEVIPNQHKPSQENLTKSAESIKGSQNECKSFIRDEKGQIADLIISPKPEQITTKSLRGSEGEQSIDHCMESNIYPSQDSALSLRDTEIDKDLEYFKSFKVLHLQDNDNGKIQEHKVDLKPQEMAHLASVPFFSKGNLSHCSPHREEIVNRSCHHFIPCELFQAMVKYSGYLTSTHNMCHSIENHSYIPTLHPSYSTNAFQVRTKCSAPIPQGSTEKVALYSCTYNDGREEDTLLIDLVPDLAQPSKSSLCHDKNLKNDSSTIKKSEHLDNEQSLLADKNMESENPPPGTYELSQNTSFSVSVLQDENEQISSDPRPIESNSTASLNTDLDSQSYKRKIKTKISKSEASLPSGDSSITDPSSCLDLSHGSPINFKQNKTLKKLNSSNNVEANSITSQNIDIYSKSCQQKNKTKISPNKASLSNCDFDTIGQPSLPDFSHDSPINSKRNKALKIVYSSDDESEELVIRKRKRTTSPSCSKKTSRIDSEEMRDFERYDDNVWKYFEEKSMLKDRYKTLSGEEKETNKTFPANEDQEGPDSEDDPIPGTAEEMNSRESDLSILNLKKKKARVLSDTESESEMVDLVSQSSSCTHFTDTTRNLFKNCNISLNLAHGVLNKSAEKLNKNIEVHSPNLPDALVGSNEGNVEVEDKDVGNESRSSVFSTQSVVISTQQRNKVQDEVETLKRKIHALEQEMMKKDADLEKCNSNSQENSAQSSLQHATGLPETKIREVEIEEGRDSDLDSEELFRTFPCPPELKTKELSHPDVKKNDTLHKSEVKPMRVICTGLSQPEVNRVQSFIEIFGGSSARFLSRWSKDITHVIVKTDDDDITERTLKYLFGVASGAWVVSIRWITNSLASSLLLPEVEYEALDCTGAPGPYRGRHVVSPVFKGCQFILIPPFEDVTLEQLSDLIRIAGGIMVKRFNENNPGLKLVVSNSGQPENDSAKLANAGKKPKVTVAHDWIIECIGMCSLVALSSYIIGSPPTMNEIVASGIPDSLIFETQDVICEDA